MKRLAALIALLSAGAIALSGTADAATDRRVALVIGNSNYQHTTPLKNPANDARDMAATLKRLGFEVIEGFDLDQAAMRDKIRAFSTAIEGASVAMFYYAGHGLQVAGNNHLAPVNARLERESDLDFETISLNLVLRQMERERRTNLVFLDACRDNPLARQLARSLTRSTAVGNGLARVESGIGMLIGYATSPGDVALDGAGRNSPYTKALLKHIETEGQDISSLMIAVRQDVLEDSGGKQVPWENSSLTGQFYFNPEPAKAAVATPVPAAPGPAGDFQAQQAVSAAYQATVAIGTCGAYRIFEEQHRGSFYGRLAEEWLRANCAKPARAVTVEKAEEPAAAASPPTQVAATTPSPPPAGPAVAEPAPVLAGAELVVALQKHLDRVGCEPGPADGDWGNRSREALERFSSIAKLDLPTDTPSQAALAALESRTDRVCPACSSNQTLSAEGTCVARAEPKQPARAEPKQPPRTVRKDPPAERRAAKPRVKKEVIKREGDRYWGGEDTRLMCQTGREFSGDCFPRR